MPARLLPNRILLPLIVACALFMENLDSTVLATALPTIARDFGISPINLKLALTSYLLTIAVFIPASGWVADRFGARTVFRIAIVLFTLGSICCGLSSSIEEIVASRILQGLGGAMMVPVGRLVILRSVQKSELVGALAWLTVPALIGPVVGPPLGGFITTYFDWRWIFWINVPLCALVIAGVLGLLPRTRRSTPGRLQLDPVGLVLLAFTIITLMWPFLFTTGAPSDDPRRWWSLVLFVVFVTAFTWWERRYAASGRLPLVPFSLFSISSFRNGTLVVTTYFTAIPAMFLLTTLFLQTGVGTEPVFAGMVSIGFAVASAITAWFGGNLVARLGRPLVVWGLVIVLVSVAALAVVAYTVPAGVVEYAMAAVMVVAGAGAGLVVAPNQTLTLADIPTRAGGLAGSVGQLGQRVGTAVGTAIGLSLFYSTIYREKGEGHDGLEVFHNAYAYGMVAVGVFVAIALLIGVIDLGVRRRAAQD